MPPTSPGRWSGVDLAPGNVAAIRAVGGRRARPAAAESDRGLPHRPAATRRRSRRWSTSPRHRSQPALARRSCSRRGPRRGSPEPIARSAAVRRRARARRRPRFAAPPGAPPTGVVVASVYLSDELSRHSQRIIDAYQAYEQLRVLRRPLEGVYLSFFLGLTLLILISATWMGLYPRQAHHPAGPAARRRRARDRRRPSRSPHRARDARRVRRPGRCIQQDGGRARRQPAAARTIAARSRAQEPGRRGPPPLSRDHPRAHRHRRRLLRRRRAASASSTAWRGGCWRSRPTPSVARRRRSSRARICGRSRRSCRDRRDRCRRRRRTSRVVRDGQDRTCSPSPRALSRRGRGAGGDACWSSTM